MGDEAKLFMEYGMGLPHTDHRNHFDGLTQLLVTHGYTVMQPNLLLFFINTLLLKLA